MKITPAALLSHRTNGRGRQSIFPTSLPIIFQVLLSFANVKFLATKTEKTKKETENYDFSYSIECYVVFAVVFFSFDLIAPINFDVA